MKRRFLGKASVSSLHHPLVFVLSDFSHLPLPPQINFKIFYPVAYLRRIRPFGFCFLSQGVEGGIEHHREFLFIINRRFHEANSAVQIPCLFVTGAGMAALIHLCFFLRIRTPHLDIPVCNKTERLMSRFICLFEHEIILI